MRATASIFMLFAVTTTASTFACGGASSPLFDDTAGDASTGDASTRRDASTRGDASTPECVNPTFGEACTTSESVCGQAGSGNPCCDAAWRCVDGTWQSFAAECACLEATCGDTTCAPGQYCMVQPPGIALEDGGTPPTSYTCTDPPSTCAGATSTCDCVEAANPCVVGSCSTSGGLITLDCIGE